MMGNVFNLARKKITSFKLTELNLVSIVHRSLQRYFIFPVLFHPKGCSPRTPPSAALFSRFIKTLGLWG
jgi:hypothetical protein